MDLEIQTKYGKVKGFTEDGLNKWYGIPYSKPPVGELRFRRAVECEPWDGVKDCTKFKGRCIQFKLPSSPLSTDSEDCLQLNIWRNNNKDEQKLPVYVWIHGGYLHTGSGIDDMYHGDSFAKNGLLYITINYRLGPLGCYNFAIYQKDLFDSNCFLSDQIMALKWIRDNIEAFGGDPHNVTIAGESAGSSSVCLLMASPAAKGLFHKAICQSGPPDAYEPSEKQLKKDKKFLDEFLRELHLQPDNIEKLRQVDIEDIQKVALKLTQSNDDEEEDNLNIPSSVYDDLNPESLFDLVKAGKVKNIKLIIGTTHDEGTYLYSMEECPMNWKEIKSFCERYDLLAKFPDFKHLYRMLPTESEQCSQFITDHDFLVNSCFLADEVSQWSENAVWMYRFDYPPPLFKEIELNATHGCDIYISANQLEGRGQAIYGDADPKVLKYLVDSMHGSFVQFAKTGDPNGAHLDVTWEQYEREGRKTLILNEKNEVVVNPNKEMLEVWEKPL